jgi:uncharacterized protein
MIIDLASLGVSPKHFDICFTPEGIDLDDGVAIEGNVNLTAEIERSGNRTRVQGTIKAKAVVECTRCLEPVALELDKVFQDLFVDAYKESTLHEAEIGAVELDESLIAGGTLDLAEVVREQILLELPEQVFCREDCRGLCTKCGANLNLINCKCEADEIDPRWAALKDLRGRLN